MVKKIAGLDFDRVPTAEDPLIKVIIDDGFEEILLSEAKGRVDMLKTLRKTNRTEFERKVITAQILQYEQAIYNAETIRSSGS